MWYAVAGIEVDLMTQLLEVGVYIITPYGRTTGVQGATLIARNE